MSREREFFCPRCRRNGELNAKALNENRGQADLPEPSRRSTADDDDGSIELYF
jgi:hypothetical protein